MRANARTPETPKNVCFVEEGWVHLEVIKMNVLKLLRKIFCQGSKIKFFLFLLDYHNPVVGLDEVWYVISRQALFQ